MTSIVDASVRRSCARAVMRWYADVQPMRRIVALGDVESVRLDASTIKRLSVALMAAAAG